MTESTARAALFELQSSVAPNFTWVVPQKPVSVRIPFPVIDRLEHEAVENFKSLSSRGSEIGGLLWGKVTAGQPAEVSIEDYELISCDYSRGPLYRLAEADMARFDRSIQEASNGLVAVGMFRSHTRKGLSLDADDLSFFDSRFAEPHQIVLLIRPFATKPSSAGIFIREGGTVHGEASYLEFPFRVSLLSSERPLVGEGGESRLATPAASGAVPIIPAPRPSVRGQIVPIASRREVPSVPSLAVEPLKPVVEHPEPDSEPAATGSEPALKASVPAESTVEEPKPEEAAAPQQPQEKPAQPMVESKAAAPKPEEVIARTASDANPPEKVIKRLFEDSVPAVDVSPASVDELPAEPEAGNKKLMWIGIGSAAVLVVLLVAFLVFPPLLHRGRQEGPPQDSSQLSLRVERTAGEILLTWNRDSDAVRSAAHAVLSISDGDQHDNVDMDLAQLRNGSISYSPASSDVVFKMEVTGKNGDKVASESVRVLRTRPSPLASSEPAPATAAQPPVKAPDVKTPDIPPAPAAIPANNANNTPNASSNPASTTDPPEETPKAPERILKPFQAPALASRLHPANATDLPDAPSLGQTTALPSASGLNIGSVAAPIAPPKPAATPAPPPAAPKAAPGGQLVQAQLISKKDPEYPKLARENGAKGIVELIATIGTDGKVKSVKVVKGPPMLTKAASDAVLQWKYRPTMLNGVPVEGQTQVFVNFLGTER